MKKLIAILTAALLTVSLLAGCQSGNSSESEAADSTPEAGSETSSASENSESAEAIVWKDMNIELEVRAVLNKPEGDITTAEAAAITELQIHDNFGIGNYTLEDLKWLPNLKILNLSNDVPGYFQGHSGVEYQDFTPLTQLEHLEELYLDAHNEVDYNLPDTPHYLDLSVIAQIPSLRVLSLSGCAWIDDITPLAPLTNLEELTMNHTGFSDLESIAQTLPNLKVLRLNSWYQDVPGSVFGTISDISPLSKMTGLTELGLQGVLVSGTDLSPLAGLTAMKVLYLNQDCLDVISGMTELECLYLLKAPLTDLSPLAGLTNLKELDIFSTGISDLSPLAGLTNLNKLLCGDNPISDLSPLAGLTNLKNLNIYSSDISDLSPLAGLTNLNRLLCGNNPISDLSPLAGLTNLEELYLQQTQVHDLTPLAGLTNLKTLYVWENELDSIDPISGLTGLTNLDLCSTGISDLTPLAGLTHLTSLSLYNNKIQDVSPLSGMTELTKLNLSENSITDFSPIENLPVWQNNGVITD